MEPYTAEGMAWRDAMNQTKQDMEEAGGGGGGGSQSNCVDNIVAEEVSFAVPGKCAATLYFYLIKLYSRYIWGVGI